MDLSLIMVEGPHDAAFMRQMLLNRGFQRVRHRQKLDPMAGLLVPAVPSDPLVAMPPPPDFYRRDTPAGECVAVFMARGVERLVTDLETKLDAVDVPALKAIAVLCDADETGAEQRMRGIMRDLHSLNRKKQRTGVAGFPLLLPLRPGEVASGRPRVGIHILPDNERAGALDTLLCSCATRAYEHLYAPARALVRQVDAAAAADSPDLAALRRGSGRDKATAGIIGNLLFPGSSLTTAIDRGHWFEAPADAEDGLLQVNSFLDHLLA